MRTVLFSVSFCFTAWTQSSPSSGSTDVSPLKYTVFLGGEASISSVAVDSEGDAYITGSASGALPVTPGAFQTNYVPATCTQFIPNSGPYSSPCPVAFAGKLNAAGTAFSYLTYLGAANSTGAKIVVDAEGDAWIAGTISSVDLPVSPGALQPKPKGLLSGFVLRLDPTGSHVEFATYLGGSGEQITGMTVDATGNVYVTGSSQSTDFPTTPSAFQTGASGSSSFISKFDATGKLTYATYFSGGSTAAIAADATGAAYITGSANSGLPVTSGAFQTTTRAPGATFVAKLDPFGTKLVYATYLAGNGDEAGTAIAVDSQGNALVSGVIMDLTNSPSSFPTTFGAFQTTPPSEPSQIGIPLSFISKLNTTGSALIYSTLLYASDSLWATDLKVDSSGNAFAVGTTEAFDFPVTPGSLGQCNPNGTFWGSVGFLLELSADGSHLVYSSYLGSYLGPSASNFMALDPNDHVYITGAELGSFPVVPGSFGWNASGAFLLNLAPTPLPIGSVGCIVNAAGRSSGSIASGEIADIVGHGIGTSEAMSAGVIGGRIGTSLGGVQVFFDGLPAPILYADPDRIRVIVPMETGPSDPSSTFPVTVQVLNGTTAIPPAVVSAAAAAPGIFTVDGSAEGLALIINEDGTLNSEQNPARQGSIVTMYATGLNQTNPPFSSGQIATGAAPLILSAQVKGPGGLQIGISTTSGVPEITYAGAAPGFVAGLTQINFQVPISIFHGFSELAIQLGTIMSQPVVYFYMQ